MNSTNHATVRRIGPDDVDTELVEQTARLLAELVAGGAALGWVDSPSHGEVGALVRDVGAAAAAGDACLAVAWIGEELVGLGYWRRYTRPTHYPHADMEKIAVAADQHGRGLGRLLTNELIHAATEAGIEVLTLDFRGDNHPAAALYRSLGFREYGRLPQFVAVGPARYDKIFYALDLRGGAAVETR
jgi:ribosomal protein S18 acetylase RimI-like enzyme